MLIVASHLTSRGVLLGGDNYLSPLALGNLAEAAKANAVFIGSCDGPTLALDIAGQAKGAAVVYYPAAMDGNTAMRLAASFVERYVTEGVEPAIQAAQAAGYQVLNPIWVNMAPTGDGFGSSVELTHIVLDMQRQQAETAVDVRYLREDMTTVKTDIKRISEAQATAGNIPARNILLLLSLAVVITALGWAVVNALSTQGL